MKTTLKKLKYHVQETECPTCKHSLHLEKYCGNCKNCEEIFHGFAGTRGIVCNLAIIRNSMVQKEGVCNEWRAQNE